jgi:hypothetical protein
MVEPEVAFLELPSRPSREEFIVSIVGRTLGVPRI